MSCAPSSDKPLHQRLISLFDLTDPAETFLAGWMTRVHLDPPRLFQALEFKRSEEITTGRKIYELAAWLGQPRRYLIITWNIDEVSMRWKEFHRRSVARAIFEGK